MKELIKFLLNNIIIDINADVDVEKMQKILSKDKSDEAKLLLEKISTEDGVNDLFLTIADFLADNLQEGITPKTIKELLQMYLEA